ncbi:transcriptional regulator [Spongiactinospora gelatinilytica]|uniref:Transcriptional regulator n=1 Tax=Spongiactinospora gelatinilytica TaxID=2666298 RepID=A0A2W2G378_9ACTN|nr:helix-turn-helix transcriptional regulator [Spongiactinospora gelatinilytica]PZG36829.1 transcriptional regulator [Spongiactinospora gelatinilytica]
MGNLPPLAARLRRARQAEGWSQKELAKLLDEAGRSLGIRMPERASLVRSIGNWETGRHVPRDPSPILLAKVFRVDVDELFGDPLKEPRRTPAEVLARILPEGDPLKPLTTRQGRRIGMSTVTDLTARVHALRLADDVMGGDDLIQPAFRELDSAVRLYREGTHSNVVRPALLTVIGEYAQIAGWIASDAGKHAQAETTYRLGISAAREADDAALESNILGALAYQVTNLGDTGRAVELAEAALTVASHAPGRARALAWDRAAWAHAREGDAQAAMRALGEAESALANDRDHDGPAYLYWVNAGELRIMEARVYTELRRPLRAVPILTDVLSRYDATHVRELALYLSWLAVALIDANEPEEAVRTAERMLDISTDVASDRTTQRARVVLGRLAPFTDVREVRELLARFPLGD